MVKKFLDHTTPAFGHPSSAEEGSSQMLGADEPLYNAANCRRRLRLLNGRILRQLALQRPAVDTKKLCCLGYVPTAIGENALNVLPFDPGEGWHTGWCVALGRVRTQFHICIENLIGIGRFCQVMVSPEFQRLHSRGNASVTGQHNHCDGGINLLNVLNQIESAEIGHLQIKQDQVRTDARRELQAFCLRVGLMGLAATVAKRSA